MICTCIPHYCPKWRECNGLVLVLPVQWSLWWLLLPIKIRARPYTHFEALSYGKKMYAGQGHYAFLLSSQKELLHRVDNTKLFLNWQGYNSNLRTIFSWTGCSPISLDVHCCCRTLNVFPPSAILCMLKSLLDPFI